MVLTRPPAANGDGLSGAEAVADLRAVTAPLGVVEENADSRRLLVALVADGGVSGKQVHDANLVAVVVTHGAAAVLTANPRHVERFGEHLAVESLV